MPAAHIERLELVPDIDTGSISITVHGSKSGTGVRAEVTANGKNIATGEGTEGTAFKVQIPDPQLWSPDSPFLYDLQVSLDPAPDNAVVCTSSVVFLLVQWQRMLQCLLFPYLWRASMRKCFLTPCPPAYMTAFVLL